MYAHLRKSLLVRKDQLDHYLQLGHEIHTPRGWRTKFDVELEPVMLRLPEFQRVCFWDWILSYEEFLVPLAIPPVENEVPLLPEIQDPAHKSYDIFLNRFQIEIDLTLSIDERHHDVTNRVRERNRGRDLTYKTQMLMEAESRVNEEEEEWKTVGLIREENRLREQYNQEARAKNEERVGLEQEQENLKDAVSGFVRKWILEQQVCEVGEGEEEEAEARG